MTTKEFYTAISENENLASDVRDFAKNALTKMAEAAKKRAEKPSKAHEENAAMIPAVEEYLSGCTVAVPASLVAENCPPLSPSKALAVLSLMIDDGKVRTEKIKSTSKSGGKINGYILVRE